MKKATLIILIIAAVMLISAGIIFAAWFNNSNDYNDIGADYSDGDAQAAADKAGIVFKDKDGQEKKIDELLQLIKDGEKELGRDYIVEYSDYEETTFELTDNEVTALLNELFPSLTFLENPQVKVLEDGKVEVTSGCKVKETLDVMYPNTRIAVPALTPKTVNLHAIGTLTINNNILVYNAEQVECILLDILPGNPGTKFTKDISKVLTSAPELFIYSMEVNSKGDFIITGNLPRSAMIIDVE